MARYKVQYDIVRRLNGVNFSCVAHPGDRVGFIRLRTAQLAIEKLKRAHTSMGDAEGAKQLKIVPILVCDDLEPIESDEVEPEVWN